MGTPSVWKTSTFKLWLRTIIFIALTAVYLIYLYQDIHKEMFPLWAVPAALIPSTILGLWLSRFVPMKVYNEQEIITFSFDLVYFLWAVLFVALKALAVKMSGYVGIADVIMLLTIGIMFGRLTRIGIRVKRLKSKYFKGRKRY